LLLDIYKQMFTKHLKETDMTYISHMLRAIKISSLMGIGCVACMIHSVIPFLFETTATDIAEKIRNLWLLSAACYANKYWSF